MDSAYVLIVREGSFQKIPVDRPHQRAILAILYRTF